MKFDKKIKKIISIVISGCIIVGGAFLAEGQLKTPPKPEIIVGNPPEINPQNPNVGEDVEITYTLYPQPFQHNVSTPKEIVLVLDRSGSMDDRISGSNKKKITQLKEASVSFINKMSEIENLKIGIVTYSSSATIAKELTDVKIGKNSLINTINDIKTGGGTNTGDGLRKAGHILKNMGNGSANKTIVFMSDGEPTFYTYTTRWGGAWDYYTELDNNTPNTNSGNDYERGEKYAIEIAEVIKKELENTNIFTVGYGLKENGNRIMNNIHKTMGGTDDNFHKTSNSIDEIFDKIADDIIAQYKIENQKLDLKLDPTVVMASSVTYPEIIYKREENGWYRANPVQIKFKITCNKNGYINVVNPGSKFEYNDIFGNKQEVEIPPLSLNIGLNSKVTIDVKDSSGYIQDKYDSSVSSLLDYPKLIQNDFGQDYKLFGESYADIKFEGDNINYLKYQVIQDDTTQEEIDNSWNVVEGIGGNGGINGDVDTSKQGYLTQQSYDVSKLPQYGVDSTNLGYLTSVWSKREDLYKYPYSDGAKYKPASTTTTNNPSDYVREEKYFNPITQQEETRWIPQNVFTQYSRVDGTYKEASKTWGYVKVPTSGKYRFGTKSDDGIKVTMVVDEQEIVLIDNFTVHGPTWDASNNIVNLDRDKYYPIFIEYYNCGAEAAFNLKYTTKTSSNNINDYTNVPKDWFYPSKSKAPGETSDGGFTGESGVKMPEQPGKYYIIYEAGLKTDNNFTLNKKGKYGPFVIDTRFTLQRNIANYNSEDFVLEYILTPNDIPVTDFYRTREELNNAQLSQNLNVNNIQLTDTLPDGFEVKSQIQPFTHRFNYAYNEGNGNKLNGVIEGIVNYTLNTQASTKEGYFYTSQPISIKLQISTEDLGEIEFSELDGKIIYNDVSLNNKQIIKEQNLPQSSFTIEGTNDIVSHGLFSNQDTDYTIQEGIIRATSGAYYTLGVKVDINRNDGQFSVTTPSNAVLDTNVYLYRCDENGKLDISTKTKINSSNISNNVININGLNKFNDKKAGYVLVYTVLLPNSNESYTSTATMDSKNIMVELNSNVEMPDLF